MDRGSHSCFKVFFILILSITFTGVVASASPNINIISPSDGKIITDGSLGVIADVSDPDNDLNTSTLDYYVRNLSDQLYNTSQYNATVDVSNYPSDNYTVNFTATDDTGNTISKEVGIYIDNGGGGGGEEGPGEETDSGCTTPNIDDFSNETDTCYSPQIAFLGNNIDIKNANSTHTYNLTAPNGSLIDKVTGAGTLDASNASTEGRYKVYNENTGNVTKIDFVKKKGSDVIGRYNSPGNIKLYYWFNSSEVNSGAYSVSTEPWPPNGSNYLYRMNTTLNKYFVAVDRNSGGEATSPSEGAPSFDYSGDSKPRINDINATKFSNITGKVVNSTGGAVANLNVSLEKRYSGVLRYPYFTGPPVKYDMTNSTGEFKFTELEPGAQYAITIANSSYTRKPFEEFGVGVPDGSSLNASSTFDAGFINTTSNLGTAKLTMKAKTDSSTQYAFLLFGGQKQAYIEPGIKPGQAQQFNLPAPANYSLIALQFDYGSSGFPRIKDAQSSIALSKGNTTSKTVGFPKTVWLNGSTSAPDSFVEARSKSGREYGARTDSNGNFTLEVKNSTTYNVTVYPDTGYKKTTKTGVTVNGDKSITISLSTGAYIAGNITSNNNPVPDVEVFASNDTVNSFGEDESNSNGLYNVSGLDKNTNHTLFIESPPKYPDKQIQVNSSSPGKVRDISLNQNTYKLSGTVNKTTGGYLNGTAYLRNEERGTNRKTTISKGKYAFNNVPTGDYGVKVVPDNSSYKEQRKFTFVDSDSTVDFNLSSFQGVSGYVKSGNQTISNVFIYAYNYTKGSYDSDVTDSNGYYSLELSKVGHKVEVWPSSNSKYTFKETSLTASKIGGSSQKNFTLNSGKYLAGKISDPGTTNFSGYISLYNYTANSYAYQEFTGGSYNLTGLKNNGYNGYVSVKNGSYSSKSFKVQKSELDGTKDITFSLNEGPKLWVTVKDTTGSVLPNATVIASGQEKTTNSNGVAKFEKQKDNSNVTIRAYKNNFNSTSATRKMKSTYSCPNSQFKCSRSIQNETVTLKNIRSELKDVSINVTRSGSTVSQASVVIRSNKSSSSLTSSAVTGSNGKATLNKVRPGGYYTSISANGNFNATSIMFGSGDKKIVSVGNFKLGIEVPN